MNIAWWHRFSAPTVCKQAVEQPLSWPFERESGHHSTHAASLEFGPTAGSYHFPARRSRLTEIGDFRVLVMIRISVQAGQAHWPAPG
jgi:hypothetical protein